LIAHWLIEPKPVVETPRRPYAAAPSASTNSWTIRMMSAAGTPLTCSASSGVKSSTSSRMRSRWSTYDGGSAKSSANMVCTIDSSTTTSEPGRTKWCSVAIFAVSVCRGSKTTICPPRSLMPWARWGKSGVVISEPFEAIGFAPNTRK